MAGVTIEVEGVAGSLCRILILESFKRVRGICNRIARTEESLEFRYEHWVRFKPFRKLTTIIQGVVDFVLKPIKRITLQVGKYERNAGFVVGEVPFARREIHRALEHEGFEFIGVGAIEDVRDACLDGGGRFRVIGDSGDFTCQEFEGSGQGAFGGRCGHTSVGRLIVIRIAILFLIVIVIRLSTRALGDPLCCPRQVRRHSQRG